MTIDEPKIFIVLPAYNAEKTLLRTLAEIPTEYRQNIILVDDHSTDRTVETATAAGLKVFRHEVNRGYGANQKTCYTQALAIGANIVVMVHPDHQYDASLISQMVQPIIAGKADAVFGSRMLGGKPLEGGMPWWKYDANILLTALANIIFRRYLTEIHSGFRAYSRKYPKWFNLPKIAMTLFSTLKSLPKGWPVICILKKFPLSPVIFLKHPRSIFLAALNMALAFYGL